MLTLVVYSRFTTPARVRGPRGGWCGSGPATSRPVVPPGFEPDQVEGGRGVGVLQAGLVQAPVAGAAHPGDGHALADGALDAGAQRVSGLEVLGVRGGAGGDLGLVDLLGVHGELAASGLGSGAPSRTGHGPQSSAEKVITMVGVPRWVTGFHERLVRPCGQIACPASKSMVNAVRSKPAPALACAEVSASIGVTSVIP